MHATAAPAVTPRRPGRPRSDAATTAVLDAAYRLSAALGLRGATLQAIASESGVSKMTIYKWWPSRLHLLIDAYLRQATAMLPLSESTAPLEAIHAHAVRYLAALQGDLGRVQLAVLAECIAEQGDSALFVEHYLRIRRDLGLTVIRRGQVDGSINADRPAEALYDQIYGAIFYRCQFGLDGLDGAFVSGLVDAVLRPGAAQAKPPSAGSTRYSGEERSP